MKKKETLKGYNREVWFDPKALTNIVCLKNVREQWPVSYDCGAGVFTVHREKDGLHDISFHMIEEGLHVYIPPSNGKAFVNTVADNMEGFSKQQVKQAKKARELYAN